MSQRALQIDLERPAELVRTAALAPFSASPDDVRAMAAERVAVHLAEQLVEDFLADPARTARRQLESIAMSLGVTGVFESLGQLLQRAQVVRRCRIEQLCERVGVELIERCRRLDTAQLIGQCIELVQARQLLERALERQALLARERKALAQALWQQLVQRRGELGQVPA